MWNHQAFTRPEYRGYRVTGALRGLMPVWMF